VEETAGVGVEVVKIGIQGARPMKALGEAAIGTKTRDSEAQSGQEWKAVAEETALEMGIRLVTVRVQ
jgi:hypothetical protein